MTDRSAPRRPALRDSPAPVPVDLRRVLLGGMAVWFVGLVVSGVLWLVGTTGPQVPLICVAGLALGCWGLVWARGRGERPSADLPPA